MLMRLFTRLSAWILLSVTSLTVFGQKIASLEVPVTKTSDDFGSIAEINLDEITYLNDSALVLTALENGKRVYVPFQISHGRQRTLSWQVGKAAKGAKNKLFELAEGKAPAAQDITASVKDGELTIHSGDQNLLRYVFKTAYPPAGIDTSFKKSGFIHPLWTPNGQVLTRIQAPDHYHHYGIWNPWTHVLFEGDTVDFWNLRDKKGTVRFGKFVNISQGPVFSEFAALHEHVAFKKGGAEKVALNELQTVRVFKPVAKDHYIVDITIEMNCAGESPFRILEYRYAGLGWRATEKWDKDNSEILTSEGKGRKDSDGTTARWFYFQGALDNDYGGAMMMSYPTNFNHPEPVRVWPESSNKRGDVFAMFAPTKTKDWLLVPGRTYALKYRFVVYNGHFDQEQAENAWDQFSSRRNVIIRK